MAAGSLRYGEGVSKRILIAAPRSFCAGVVRAIDIVEKLLDTHGPPVYVRHEIVHNVHVVRDLEARGAVFVESEQDVPEGVARGAVRSRRGSRGLPQVRGAESRGRRRGVPARVEGACRGEAVRGARPQDRARRPCRARGGRGNDGRGSRGNGARRDRSGRPGSRGRGWRGTRVPHPDDALARRHVEGRGRAPRAFPRSRRAAFGGHLLRDPEPAGCRQADLRGGDGRPRRRVEDELEREPARRSCQGPGRGRVI